MARAQESAQQIRRIGVLKTNAPPGSIQDQLTGSLIINAEARRAFQIFQKQTGIEFTIRVLDLDTLRPLGQVVVHETIETAARSAAGEYAYALDTERNMLYLVTRAAVGFKGILVIDGNRMRVDRHLLREKSTDPTAPVQIDQDDKEVHLCASQSCLLQVPGVSPTVMAMDLVPSFLSGANPKVLMLWEEPNGPFINLNANHAWVAQWDAITGRQDYIWPLPSCRNRGFPNQDASRYALSIFQARLGTGVYLGCNAAGGTGQVVRITLDNNGRPTAEETFPGPTNVADVLADKEDDRLLFRVMNEEGESYWVFNGGASSYSGVVGVTLSQVGTTTGLDPTTGRMYVLSPPNASGRQTSTGGLMMSDIRRNPAPQALVFPEFADSGYAPIVVDPFAPGGTRRVFIRPAGAEDYLIFQDDVPVTTDPPLTDLDRFTTDVREQQGVTDANYTGTGHAYGLRALFVGGLEGVTPIGADASGIRVGRYTPRQLGSPCLPGDRHLIIGSVQEALLANNLTSAAATSGETDPGTITDVAQPSQRCYPKPRIDQGDGYIDPFGALYPHLPNKEYPRPLDKDSDRDGTSDTDERLGTEWPFGIAQCASEGAQTKRSKLKPLNRGDDIPREHRDREVDPGGFNADVRCQLEKSKVHAAAEATAFEKKDLPIPGVPFIRVGDVSSYSNLYRDRKLGLVSESVAFVRDVNIANRIFIDTAFTYAQARAAGRPGTATTTFIRRLCGVRIPEVQIHEDRVDLNTEPQHVGDPVYDTTKGLFPDGIDIPHGRDDLPNHLDNRGVDVGDVDPLNPDTDDVNVNGVDVDTCGDPQSATSVTAQLGQQPVIDAMNRVIGSRGRVSAPQPDSELRQGSPGGYLASVQKDRLQQIGARSVQNDDSTQVPALEIAIFNDDPKYGRGRQVYQLAGVDASVTYGIFLLNPEEVLADPGSFEEILIDVTGPPLTKVLGEQFSRDTPPPRRRGGPIIILYEGVAFLLRSPRDALLAAAIWGLLFAPVQLMLRRRALRAMG